MQSFFITFEGADGGGKSTQLKLLAATLIKLGYKVTATREPGGTALAEEVRRIVLDAALPLTNATQVLLYLAARNEHVDKVIRPALAEGRIVLCDRFSDSTLVYQGYSVGADKEQLEQLELLNAYATGGLKPDLTLVLDGRPRVLAERRRARGITDRYEEQGLKLQDKLRQGFLALVAKEPRRIKVIDAEGTMEEVQRCVLAAVLKLLKRD